MRRILVRPYVPPEFESRSQRGFLRYTYTGPYTLEALRADLDRVVPDLSQIECVALVQARGGRERLIEIELNEDRVSSLRLSPGVVNNRINDLDLVREAGAVREGDREWSVTIQNRVARAEEILGTVLLENQEPWCASRMWRTCGTAMRNPEATTASTASPRSRSW